MDPSVQLEEQLALLPPAPKPRSRRDRARAWARTERALFAALDEARDSGVIALERSARQAWLRHWHAAPAGVMRRRGSIRG